MHISDINQLSQNEMLRAANRIPWGIYHKGDSLWNTVMATYLSADSHLSPSNTTTFFKDLLSPKRHGYIILIRFAKLDYLEIPTPWSNINIADYVGKKLLESTTGAKGYVWVYR